MRPAIALIAAFTFVALSSFGGAIACAAASIRIGATNTVVVLKARIPNATAVVQIYAQAAGLNRTRLVTLFIPGGSGLTGSRTQTIRQQVTLSRNVVTAIERDPHATLTVVACTKPRRCVITGPIPVAVQRRH